MKQTNYHLFDFLDFSPGLSGEDILWKACKPVNIKESRGDVIVAIPFQQQQCSNDISPDNGAKRKNYTMHIRAYGKKAIRISTGFAPGLT